MFVPCSMSSVVRSFSFLSARQITSRARSLVGQCPLSVIDESMSEREEKKKKKKRRVSFEYNEYAVGRVQFESYYYTRMKKKYIRYCGKQGSFVFIVSMYLFIQGYFFLLFSCFWTCHISIFFLCLCMARSSKKKHTSKRTNNERVNNQY